MTTTTTMPRLNLAMDDTALRLTRDEQARVLAKTRADARYACRYIMGLHRVSGNDLVGRAKSFGGRYHNTRLAVHARCADLGIQLIEVIGRHGCRSIWSVDALAVHFGVPEPRRRSRRRADDQLVIDALAAVAAGTARQRVARELGVAVSTVRRWCRRAGIVRGMRAVEFMP
jgi:hypothetical protein